MSSISFLSKTRGTRNLVSRIRTVLNNFGISSKKFEYLLRRYSTITLNLGCVPSFPITAVILKRHPKLIRKLSQQGVEFAVHGYIHTDYGVLPFEKQKRHYKKAIDTFIKYRVPFTGFRAPFLRTNDMTFKVISNLGFNYDSSRTVHWDVIDKNKYSNEWSEYEKILTFYKSQQAEDCLSLPRFINGFVEIPVSIPDDEVMKERLNITDVREIEGLWKSILETTYYRGELFTLQLHPERILHCDYALEHLIQYARRLNPTVWIASLKEITEWWKERDKFTFKIHSQGNNKYRVEANCSNRATILLKNGKVNTKADPWFDGYQIVTKRNFILESPKRPVIGIGLDSSPAAIKFLKSEGYITEQSNESGNYEIFFDKLTQFDESKERVISELVEQSDAPLLRYWRWPGRTRSALSITGDIDSITLIDFVLRILENCWQNLKKS